MDIVGKENALKFGVEGNSVSIPFTLENPKIEVSYNETVKISLSSINSKDYEKLCENVGLKF